MGLFQKPESVSDEDYTSVMKPYIGFLIDKINRIYDAWDNGNTFLALARAIRLSMFLPPSSRKRLRKTIEQIDVEVDRVQSVQGIGIRSTNLQKHSSLETIADKWIVPFLEEEMDEIDRKGFIERPFLYGFKKNPKRIGEDMFK